MRPSAPGWTMSSATSINSTDAERLPGSSRAAVEGRHAPALALLRPRLAGGGHRRRGPGQGGQARAARSDQPDDRRRRVRGRGPLSDAGAAGRPQRPGRPPDGLSESMRAVLEREKMLVLRSIKELEFDRAMGKLSEKDFDEMAGQAARAGDVADAAARCRRRLSRAHRTRAEGAGQQSLARPAREKRVKSSPDVPQAAARRDNDVRVRCDQRSGRGVLQAVRHEAGRGKRRMRRTSTACVSFRLKAEATRLRALRYGGQAQRIVAVIVCRC